MNEEINAPTIEQDAPTTEHDVDLSQGFLGEDANIPTEEVTEDIPTEEPIQEEEVQDEKTEEPAAAPFLTIKYNKESRDLSQDEARELAQKGMNYDAIYGKYEMLRPYEAAISELNDLATANGMSVEDYLKNLSDVQSQFELNRELENLKKQYEGADENLLLEVARNHVTQTRAEKQSAQNKKTEDENTARRQEIERQVNKFQTRYPDLDPSKLDQEVYGLMRDGYTLLEAYESVQADKRAVQDRVNEKQSKINLQNEENKKKSLGNTMTTGEIEKNAFMEAFLSED